MPIMPTPLPEDRVQPAARTARLREEGSHTQISDSLGKFGFVKPVAWVRNRAGDDNHWTNKPIQLPPQDRTPRIHPDLKAFQEEQARAEARRQATKAASVESPTTSSIYGAHALLGSAAAADVNSIGAEQIQEQQSKLWGSLDITSKRLGFAISQAAEGSSLREIEKAQNRRRFTSVAAASYTNPAGKKVELVVPESMNRTSSGFPLSPVNKYSAFMLPSTVRNPKAALGGASSSSSGAASPMNMTVKAEALAPASTASNLSLMPPLQPELAATAKFAQTLKEMPYYETSAYSTAHAMGYGKRHLFARHYLSSAPDPN